MNMNEDTEECSCGHSSDGLCHCCHDDGLPVINDYDEQAIIDNLDDWD